VSSLSFARKVFSNTLFSIADVLILKIGTTLAFIVLVRLLSAEAIAAVGIATGYLLFISYLDVAPIRILLRDYPKVVGDSTKRNELLTALFSFWCLQTVLMLLLAGALIAFVIAPLDIQSLAFLYIAMTIDFIALSLQSWLKIIYYADFRQRAATRLSLFLGIGRLAVYGLLLFMPSLVTYSWILIASAFGTGLTWFTAFFRSFQYSVSWHARSPALLLESLKSYGLWDHLNRLVIDTLLTVDLVILSWNAGTRDMSSYTIALRFVSLLTLIPLQLNAALQVAAANYETAMERSRAIGAVVKINFLVSVVQLLGIFLFGRWLMALLFGSHVAPEAFHYMLVLAGGVTLFNLSVPLMGVINNHCRMDKAFAFVFLPELIFGTAVYTVSAATFGAVGIAWGKVVACGALATGLWVFVAKCSPVTIERRLITSAETALLRKLFKGATE